MIIEQIDKMIELQGVYEIVYRKEDEEHTWHISYIEKHKDYDGKVITAYCHELEKDLNYSVSKIVSAQRYWIDIIEDDATAPQNGIYLFTCRGDNHLITELYYLNQGERLYKFFEGEFRHSNGWFEVIPLAYHFVSDYNSDTLCPSWSEIPEELKYGPSTIVRIIAFNSTKHVEMPSYVVRDSAGIQYFLLDTFDFFGPDMPFNHDGDQGTTLLGIYTAISYTEMNHGIHWDLYNKAHPKTQ